tara:strand:+ start:130 stop:1359 length:1230 start_codon:yes stop_codon:yes gene_type:complete
MPPKGSKKKPPSCPVYIDKKDGGHRIAVKFSDGKKRFGPWRPTRQAAEEDQARLGGKLESEQGDALDNMKGAASHPSSPPPSKRARVADGASPAPPSTPRTGGGSKDYALIVLNEVEAWVGDHGRLPSFKENRSLWDRYSKVRKKDNLDDNHRSILQRLESFARPIWDRPICETMIPECKAECRTHGCTPSARVIKDHVICCWNRYERLVWTFRGMDRRGCVTGQKDGWSMDQYGPVWTRMGQRGFLEAWMEQIKPKLAHMFDIREAEQWKSFTAAEQYLNNIDLHRSGVIDIFHILEAEDFLLQWEHYRNHALSFRDTWPVRGEYDFARRDRCEDNALLYWQNPFWNAWGSNNLNRLISWRVRKSENYIDTFGPDQGPPTELQQVLLRIARRQSMRRTKAASLAKEFS